MAAFLGNKYPSITLKLFVSFIFIYCSFHVFRDSTRTCRIVSFSGGGVYGAYEAGVIKGLVEKCHTKSWDVYTGVSVGALNAAWLSSIARESDISTQATDFVNLWNLHFNDRKMVYQYSVKKLLDLYGSDSILDNTPMKENIKKFLQPRGDPKCPLVIGSTSLKSGTMKQFLFGPLPPQSNTSMNSDIGGDDFYNIVLASASFPGLFPPVRVNDDLLVDGGVVQNEILEGAIKACPLDSTNIEIDVIMHNPKKISNDKKDFYTYFENIQRSYLISKRERTDFFLSQAMKNPQIDKVRVFQPQKPLPGSLLSFKYVTELTQLGYDSITLDQCSSY